MTGTCLAEALGTAPAAARDAILNDLTRDELLTLEYDWPFWARPAQLPPPEPWTIWLQLGGRGSGKTRSGAEWVREGAASGRVCRMALIAPTAADARDVMVEGESGILAISPPHFRPAYEPSKRRLTWPNGAMATLYSADEPERLRGPQHDRGWADELGAWRYPEAWDQFLFGLRLGAHPQAVVTTTPKPTRLIRDLLTRADCHVTRMRTVENVAHLAPSFLTHVVAKYQGTRLGRQELDAELLEDVEGALWTRALIEEHRLEAAPDLVRIVVAIDPAAKSREDSNETGIVVAGLGADGHGYVLRDGSGRYPPIAGGYGRQGWANIAARLYREHQGDRIIAEDNNGGEMVETTLRMVDTGLPVRRVTASRGKTRRAEPVAALYEQGKVHHVGTFHDLEDQMCTYVPSMSEDQSASPDRMDALVWALTDLIVGTPQVWIR